MYRFHSKVHFSFSAAYNHLNESTDKDFHLNSGQNKIIDDVLMRFFRLTIL